MKFLQRIALKLINLIVIVSCIAMVVCLFEEMTAGSLSFVEFIGNALIVLAVYKLFRSRFCQSLLARFLGWDPFEAIQAENRRFSQWYDSVAAQKRAQQAEQSRRDDARRAARSNAYFHESQAKRYAGTYDGYRHANQAKRYWNESK